MAEYDAIAELLALVQRLNNHADGIENIAAMPMASDMRLAAQAIIRQLEQLGEGK
jgi:hypothetical protein